MTFEDSIKEIYNKEPNTFSELIIVSTIGGSNLLYHSTNEKEYNIKHRLECILCSMFFYIIIIDDSYPSIKRRMVEDFIKFIENLISKTELTELHMGFLYNDIFFSYPARYSFYADELFKIKPGSTNIPFRLLNLIYDNPAIFDLELVKSCKFDLDLDIRIPQTIKVMSFLRHVTGSLKMISNQYAARSTTPSTMPPLPTK